MKTLLRIVTFLDRPLFATQEEVDNESEFAHMFRCMWLPWVITVLMVCLSTAAHAYETGTWVVGPSSGTWQSTPNGRGGFSVSFSGTYISNAEYSYIEFCDAPTGVFDSLASGWGIYANPTYPSPRTFTNIGDFVSPDGSDITVYIYVVNTSVPGNITAVASAQRTFSMPNAGFSTTVHLVNNGSGGAHLRFYQGAELKGEYTMTGTAEDYLFTSDSVEEVVVKKVVAGATKVGASFVVGLDSDEAEFLVDRFVPGSDGRNVERTTDVTGPRDKLPDAKKGMWETGGTSLDGALFREGIDKLDAALQGVASAGAGVSMTATNEKLGEIHETLQATDDKLGTIKGVLTGGQGFNITGGITSAQGKLADALNGREPIIATGNANVQTPSGGQSTFPSFEMPGVGTLDVSFERIYGGQGEVVLVWARAILSVVLGIAFARASSKDVQAYLIGLAGTDAGGGVAGVENMVPGVAQAKTYAVAGVATAAIFTAIAAFVVLIDGILSAVGVSVGGLVTSGINLSGAPGAAGAAWTMLDRWVPMQTILTLGIFNAARSYMLAPIFMTCVATIKIVRV